MQKDMRCEHIYNYNNFCMSLVTSFSSHFQIFDVYLTEYDAYIN